MKRILLTLSFAITSLICLAQNDYQRTKPVGNSTANMATYNKQTIVDANLRASLTLYVPKGNTPTLNNAKDSVGAVFFSTADSHFYVYRGSATWDKYARYSDISQVVTDSLANYQKLPNTKITGCTITVAGDSITVSSGSFRINGQVYSASTRLFPDVPYSPDGTQRYLTFIGTTGGIIDTLGGIADSIATYPSIAYNQADLGSVLVGSGSIGQPSAPVEILAGGAITSIPTVGYNPGTNLTSAQFIQNVFYQSQSPTASLSGGQTLEKRPSGTTSVTLNWSAGRLASTQPLSSIVVAGVSQTFIQPSSGSSVSGTQAVSVTNNSNTTYANTVTTVDSKTASANTTVSWSDRRFYGRSASATPDETIIEASAGGASQLSNSRAGTFIITASGSNFPYFSYPVIYGALTSIKDVNNFEVLSSFNQTTVSVTNSFGLTISMYVYTLNASTASNYQITTQ